MRYPRIQRRGEETVGFVVKPIEVYHPERPEKRETLDLLVDTGALHSVIPAHVLESLGIRRLRSSEFEMIDGSVIARDLGVAATQWNDKRGATDVIFGEPNDKPVLGVLSLEAMGLEVDPVRGELKPMQLLLL